MAFQVTSPLRTSRVLLPHALVMHINPQNYSENHTKKVERIQTRGGFVEQHWGDELTDISADGSTGAFMNIYTGLTSVLRQRTIAWDRYRDLHDLYRNNGSLFDPFGNIVLQGKIMLMFDRGTYLGHFENFETEETDDQPFAFKISWSFKVEEELMKIPGLVQDPAQRGQVTMGRAPAFQGNNALETQSTAFLNSRAMQFKSGSASTLEEIQSLANNERLAAEAEKQFAQAEAEKKKAEDAAKAAAARKK